jgi:hypothetical protein
MSDTPAEIQSIVRERLLARSCADRLVMGCSMFDAARAMVLASFPEGLSEIESKGRLCRRLYGDEVDVEGFIEHLAKRSGTIG